MKKRAARIDLRSLLVALGICLAAPHGVAQNSEQAAEPSANTDPLVMLAGLTEAARGHAYRGTQKQLIPIASGTECENFRKPGLTGHGTP